MAIIDLLLQSHSVHDIADSLGVSIPTVYKTQSSFASMDTIKRVDPHGQRVRGIVTVEDPIKVGRGEALSQHERVKIAFGLEQRLSHREIARSLNRCQSTVSREIRRHSRNGIYESGCAHTRARQNRQRIQPRKIDTSGGLKAKVVRLLRCGVSPEQISARLRFLYPDNEGMNISHESIYQALYVQGAGSLRQELKVEKALRSGRTSRIPRCRLAGVITRGNKSWVHGAEISLRPPQAEDR
ncbi:transposase, partial [Corynebacterium flavescens]|uniref:transposase n=1 Tax=Corynebacterium flavescens TaxID=28028 RepID=UPI003FD5A6E3